MEISELIKRGAIRSLLFLVPVLLCILSFAQTGVGKCEFKNNEFTVEVSKNAPADQLSNFIDRYDLGDLDLKTVFKTNNLSALKAKGWKIKLNTDKTLVITKPLTGSANLSNPADNLDLTNREPSIAQRFPPTGNGIVYGINRFRNKHDFAIKNSDVTFFLRGYSKAHNVVLAGSFNEFSPNTLHMKKTDSGWVAMVKLKPGKYWYKFVADGYWMIDDDNYLRENDGLGNTNSVYYKPNHVFVCNGLSKAKKAYVTGSFNRWRRTELAMNKIAAGWALPIYLADGTHTYKYFVDNTLYTDIYNANKLPDGFNGYNSVVRFGKPHLFALAGYTNAKQVALAGTFNSWRRDELLMTKTATGWQLPYALGAGNYEYKFVVDGKWITDPANPLKATPGGEPNSYLIIGANYTFRLKGAANAKEVRLSGDFNGWNPNALAMQKQGDEWVFSVYLSPGKHKYKFVVDGKWITDPANKNWEQNEFGTGNSIVWVENE